MTGNVARHTARKAHGAICAGLALATTLAATPLQALADDASLPAGEYASATFSTQATSKGDTKLYVTARQDNLTMGEGGTSTQLKVTIPVAIHYVADTRGNLSGPSDNTVKFVNHTRLGAVHVSKIAVESEGDASIVKASASMAADTLAFNIKPVQGTWDDATSTFSAGATEGTLDELGAYVNTADGRGANPTKRDEWNIARSNGALSLNSLTGKAGDFAQIDPFTDYHAGIIHWTIRAGTRAEADARDGMVTIHYHANDGANANCDPIDDKHVTVLERDAETLELVAVDGVMESSVGNGDGLVPPSVVDTAGNTTNYRFKGWSLTSGGDQMVSKLKDLGSSAASIAGKTFELFAIYEPSA